MSLQTACDKYIVCCRVKYREFKILNKWIFKQLLKRFSGTFKMNTRSYLFLSTDGSVNEDVVITKPFGNGRMTCREIRRNSAGCLKFRDECQKCKDIQHIGKMTQKSTQKSNKISQKCKHGNKKVKNRDNEDNKVNEVSKKM